MKTIVLDKSALVAAPGTVLGTAKADFQYYLTASLLLEIKTDRRNIDGLLYKVLACTQDAWLPGPHDLARWEFIRGKPATVFLKRPGVIRNLNSCYEEPSTTVDVAAYLEPAVRLNSFTVPMQKDISDLQKLQGSQFFPWLAEQLQSHPVVSPAYVARLRIQAAQKQGLCVSPSFCPKPGWYLYGLQLAWNGSRMYKLWAKGNDPMDEAKPENFALDAQYLAVMSVADGLLSNDKPMLKLAWACFPKKRSSIYTYDQEQQDIAIFYPDWA